MLEGCAEAGFDVAGAAAVSSAGDEGWFAASVLLSSADGLAADGCAAVGWAGWGVDMAKVGVLTLGICLGSRNMSATCRALALRLEGVQKR